MFCSPNITLWQESTQLSHGTTSITITSVLSPLTDHHTYMFHSFTLHSQTISYYSFPSHLMSTNMTQTLVKWKTEYYEKNKNSNTDYGDQTACWQKEIQRLQKALPVHKIHTEHESVSVNEVHYTLVQWMHIGGDLLHNMLTQKATYFISQWRYKSVHKVCCKWPTLSCLHAWREVTGTMQCLLEQLQTS
jgi:hypothetical protein